MSTTDVLEWKFTPADYFEHEFEIDLEGLRMKVADGLARAEIDSDFFDANPNIGRQFHEALHDRLLGVQLLTHRPFELSTAQRARISPNGARQVFLEIADCIHVHDAMSVDAQTFDADGNLIRDTKCERINEKKRFADAVAEFRKSDATFAAIIASYDAAVREPAVELVRLFEICEAIVEKFGKEAVAAEAVGMSSTKWKRFRQLCNDREVKQGRHRGQHIGEHRDATPAELDEVRTLARGAIAGFIAYLKAEKARGGQCPPQRARLQRTR